MDNDVGEGISEALKLIAAAITENTELVSGELSGLRTDIQELTKVVRELAPKA